MLLRHSSKSLSCLKKGKTEDVKPLAWIFQHDARIIAVGLGFPSLFAHVQKDSNGRKAGVTIDGLVRCSDVIQRLKILLLL